MAGRDAAAQQRSRGGAAGADGDRLEADVLVEHDQVGRPVARWGTTSVRIAQSMARAVIGGASRIRAGCCSNWIANTRRAWGRGSAATAARPQPGQPTARRRADAAPAGGRDPTPAIARQRRPADQAAPRAARSGPSLSRRQPYRKSPGRLGRAASRPRGEADDDECGITRREALRNMAVAGAGGRPGSVGSVDELIAQRSGGEPQARQAVRHRARGDPDSGEPLVRSLLRDVPRRPRLRRPHGPRPFFQQGTTASRAPVPPRHGCLADITHDWGPQHQAWNGGRMDGSCSPISSRRARRRRLAGRRDDGLLQARRTCPSTTRWRTSSRSATATTAR